MSWGWAKVDQYHANMALFKRQGVAGGAVGWLGFATIQLPHPSLAGTWAELGNKLGLSCTHFYSD